VTAPVAPAAVGPTSGPTNQPDRTWFFEANRTRLRVWDWGDPAAPVVVCAHGAHDHGRMWDGLAPRLAGLGYRVVAPDLRGHGDSGRVATGSVWTATAIDLALLARHLGAPVGWVGHSFGGGQVMYAGAVWPELTRWVVSLDSLGPGGGAFGDRDLAGLARDALDHTTRLLTTPPRLYPDRGAMVDRRQQANPRMPRAWVEHLVAHGSVQAEGGWRWKVDPMFGTRVPGVFNVERLNAQHGLLTAPTLVLTGGEHDTWSELSEAELADRLAHLPGAHHEVVADAGHYVHLEQPDAVMRSITAFLAQVGP
jgi:pimeloyl-ACP methyl ester carboxylesterase